MIVWILLAASLIANLILVVYYCAARDQRQGRELGLDGEDYRALRGKRGVHKSGIHNERWIFQHLADAVKQFARGDVKQAQDSASCALRVLARSPFIREKIKWHAYEHENILEVLRELSYEYDRVRELPTLHFEKGE